MRGFDAEAGVAMAQGGATAGDIVATAERHEFARSPELSRRSGWRGSRLQAATAHILLSRSSPASRLPPRPSRDRIARLSGTDRRIARRTDGNGRLSQWSRR
jgi:hypothetical protein